MIHRFVFFVLSVLSLAPRATAQDAKLIEAAPKYSSKILIMSRRVGDCPGQEKGKTL